MISTKASKNLKWIYSIIHTLNFNPPYQRNEGVWKRKKKQEFMRGFFSGYVTQPIFLRKVENSDGGIENEVVDGQQRLSTILEFRRGDFRLPEKMPDVRIGKNLYNVSGLLRNELHEKVREWMDEKTFDFVIIENATTEEAVTQFRYLNDGAPLNAAEKRNCIYGKMNDLVRQFSKHQFFDIAAVNNKRSHANTVIAQMLMIEFGEAPEEIKAPEIDAFYEKYKHNVPTEKVEKFKRKLDILRAVFDSGKKVDLRKGNVVSAYIAVSLLLGKVPFNEETCAKFFDWFNGSIKTINKNLHTENIRRIGHIGKRSEIIKKTMVRGLKIPSITAEKLKSISL
jgi:hypothetical protein